ncbi:unnamed protein product [Lampetra planeri]
MEFTSPVLRINGVDGSSSTLHCFNSSPTVQPRRVTWYKNYPDEKLASWDGAGGVVYPPHRGKLWHLLLGVEGMNWSLKLNSTRYEDAGLYACDAQLEDGREEVMVVRLSVMHACQIVLTNEEIPKTLGDSVLGRVCLYGDNSSNSSLSIKALTANDAGYYKVTAVWDSGDGELRSESQQFLAVHEVCEVYTPRDPLRCAPGETVTLPCQAYSPLCALDTVTWLKVTSGNQSIVRHMKTGNNHTEAGYKGRVRLAALGAHDASLILTDVRLNDSGIYTCQHRWGPENEIRSSDASVTLVVQRELLPRTREMTTKALSFHVTSGAAAAAAHVTAEMLQEVVVVVAVVVIAAVVIVVLICHFTRKGGRSTNDVSPPENEYEELRQREIVYDHLERDRKATRGAASPPLGPTI